MSGEPESRSKTGPEPEREPEPGPKSEPEPRTETRPVSEGPESGSKTGLSATGDKPPYRHHGPEPVAKQARLRRSRPPDHGQPQPPQESTPVRSLPPENEGHGVERSDEVGSPDPSNANKLAQEKQGRQCSTDGSLAKKRARPPSRHRGPEHQTNQWSHYRLVLNTELNTDSSRLFFGQDRGLANIPQRPVRRKGHWWHTKSGRPPDRAALSGRTVWRNRPPDTGRPRHADDRRRQANISNPSRLPQPPGHEGQDTS